jgi:nucleotide-binding universal stress UspA family protein
MFRRILVPTDGSKLSDKAVQAAIELAAACGGSIVVFHAYPQFYGGAYGTFEMANEVLAEAHQAQEKAVSEQLFAAAAAKAAAAGVDCAAVAVESDHPWEAILAAAKKRKCDSICMASHGRRGLAGILLGSETQKVLTHATLPVLVLR